MPNTMHPKMEEWVSHIQKTVGKPDKDCYFVGHSLGCIAILRYLETLGQGKQIGGSILVAGFSSSLGYKEHKTFFDQPVDWEKIKSKCKKFVAIHSDNDPFVPIVHGQIFKKELGAKLVIQHNMKHFTEKDGFTQLPVLLENVIEISRDS